MTAIKSKSTNDSNILQRRRNIILKIGITSVALIILSIYLMPLIYGGVTSLKTKAQASDPNAPILPSEAVTFAYEGDEYDVLQVPTDEGIQEWALVQTGAVC